jgi:hypothetical protein
LKNAVACYNAGVVAVNSKVVGLAPGRQTASRSKGGNTSIHELKSRSPIDEMITAVKHLFMNKVNDTVPTTNYYMNNFLTKIIAT